MKKILCLICAAVLLCSLCACGAASSDSTKDSASAKAKTKIDVDLTAMSSTMVYSEVSNMMQKPDEYMGKTVRMSGKFSAVESNGKRYFACVIQDATACCAQGIEFDCGSGLSYPADYPEEDAQITVTGTFTTYMEGSNKYLQLKDAVMKF